MCLDDTGHRGRYSDQGADRKIRSSTRDESRLALGPTHLALGSLPSQATRPSRKNGLLGYLVAILGMGGAHIAT
jgi:hypothetical protein